ncbi:MAG: hypothetical protein COZ17_03625 [Flavobacteriaceae bacterium CG_4_10_14_3_um_filter_33_47]|nr:MAG: hypothetical protein COZ17_03625 [Flavobacteriaceae bacterium CG_4_10_14_3_um_filter_33_47]PJB20320.1 MAG: hypothetical protein CO117_01420 [Flavobacteriaceae bacterium CG_4_9_14_3_um_filter_33_16]
MKSKLIIWVFCFYCFMALGQNTVTEIEYFFDTDPGVGNAINVDITDAANINETLLLPINSLSSGIHILHMRTKNDVNKWSLYARQTFYIANFSSTLNNSIIEAEYFFDTDPGVGNAQPLTITNGTTLNTTFAIPLNSINTGIHILHIRVKNNFNQWSLYGRQVFYKSPQITNNTIVAAEFFIDTDPGVGNAAAISITQGAFIDETLNISIPNDLSAGDHILHIRVQSSNGNWSLYGRPEFTSTLTNDDVVFKDFKMYPNPVEDVLHFSIQNNTIQQIKLVDINGRIVLETSNNIKEINLSNIPTGFYLLQIETTNGSISKKIIKK